MTATSENKKPAAEVREGSVRIAIWERSGSKGKFFTAGKPELSYKDENDKWVNDAGSYGEFDVVDLMVAAAKAKSELRRLNRDAKKEASEADAGDKKAA